MQWNLAISGIFLSLLGGCSTHHWAAVESSQLPPPPGKPVLHTGRLIVDISGNTDETQCVVDEKHHPVCFYNLRPAVRSGLERTLWPSFPDIVMADAVQATPGDYVLQIELALDALPPDSEGPGWSAGVRGRFRLMRDGQVLTEETTASRSRSHFAYGGPLGEGATEAVDATLQHIAQVVFEVPETRPDVPAPLPQVAVRSFSPPDDSRRPQESALKPRLDQGDFAPTESQVAAKSQPLVKSRAE